MTIQTLPSERGEPRSTPRDARRGSIVLFSIILTIVLVGVIGLGLDTALVMSARQQLQRTADAASLAAAAKVKLPGQTNYDATRQAALDTAAAMNNDIVRCGPTGILLDANTANVATGDVVVGRWWFNPGTHAFEFAPSTGFDPRNDAVQVQARCASGSLNSALDLMFGSWFGTNTSNVGRTAIARQGRRPWPLILVLHPTRAGALTINGNSHMDVLAGTIQVDSNHATSALRMNGVSGVLEAQETRVVGQANPDGPPGILGNVVEGATYVPDPLASLLPPSTVGMVNRGGITTAGTYPPGYYPNGINVNGGNVFLQSGIYVIGGLGASRGIDLQGDAVLRSIGGVLIYTEPGASISTSGAGSGMVLSPLLTGVYNGVTIFMARTGNGDADIGGSGIFEIRGTFYMPNGEMRMHGNVTRTVAQMIVNLLLINGDAVYEITGLDVVTPTGPQYVFLVN